MLLIIYRGSACRSVRHKMLFITGLIWQNYSALRFALKDIMASIQVCSVSHNVELQVLHRGLINSLILNIKFV